MRLALKTLQFAFLLCLTATWSARAGDLMQVTASTTDTLGPPATVTAADSSVINLVSDLINGQGQFSAFSGRSFDATLRYGSVQNALSFSVTQSGGNWMARMTTPFQSGLIDHSFTASSQSDLEGVIKDYLKKDGSSDLARFLAAIDKNSITGVLDGNPSAASARSADLAFQTYAFGPTYTAGEEAQSGPDQTSSTGVSMTASAGEFSSQGIKGHTYDYTLTVPFALGSARRVRLEVALPLSYTDIEGASEFGVGLQLALPILVVKHTKDQPWTWQVTPIGGTLAAGSEDLASGGLLGMGGLASYAAYHWGPWEFSMGNALTFYEGIKLTISGYSFDPDVDQQIVKNGLKVGRQLGQHWYVEAYGIDTEFTHQAFTPRYTTVGAGVGYRGPKHKGFLMLGTYMDFAPGYSAAKLQFGTGWKF